MTERRQSTFAEFDARVVAFQSELSQHSVQTESVKTPPRKGVGKYSGRSPMQTNYGQLRAAQT